MATALKGVNASASGLVVAAALILGQSYATSLPEQVLAMLCFSGITFFGVHQALTVLPNPDPNPNPNPDPNSNPNPNPNPDPDPDPNPNPNPSPEPNPSPNPDPNSSPNPNPNP